MDQADELISLKVNIPDRVVIQSSQVARIIAESTDGSFGILPHRLDCIAALVPGILVYAYIDGNEKYVAIDEGILIKAGLDVIISVRNAIAGDELQELRTLVENTFKQRSEQEQAMRRILAKIEDDFIRLYHEVHYE